MGRAPRDARRRRGGRAGLRAPGGRARLALYYLAWIALGIGMRLCLYDAAFASLARAAGPTARRPMSQITLFGGLASTVMWPVGRTLAGLAGLARRQCNLRRPWRASLPLYLALPLIIYAARPAPGTRPPRAWPAAWASAAWQAPLYV